MPGSWYNKVMDIAADQFGYVSTLAAPGAKASRQGEATSRPRPVSTTSSTLDPRRRTRSRVFGAASTVAVLMLACRGQEPAGPESPSVPILSTAPWRTEPLAPPILGARKTVVILARFQNMLPVTRDPSVYREAIFDGPNSLDAYVRDVSYGRASLSGEVYGWYELNEPAPCSFEGTTLAAMAAADDDISYSDVQTVIVITPQAEPLCDPPFAAGNSTIGAVSLQSDDGPFEAGVVHVIWEGFVNLSLVPPARTVLHELLHSFGMWHENSLDCGANALSRTGTCSSYEYGMGFSILGSFDHGFEPSALAREVFGWLPEEEILTATGPGDYVIYPVNGAEPLPVPGARALRVPLPSPVSVRVRSPTSETAAVSEVYFEYRRPVGFDAPEFVGQSGIPVNMGGALVYGWAYRSDHLRNFATRRQITTLLLDATPESVSLENVQQGLDDFSDGLVLVGHSFYGPEGTFSARVLTIRADGGLVIRIELSN